MKCVILLLTTILLNLTACTAVYAETSPTVDTLVRPDMLNVELAYLEHILGPAKYVDVFSDKMQDRTYVVGACTLHAFSDARKVTAYGVELAAGCSFDLGPFMGIGQLPANQVTMRQIARAQAPGTVVGFSATCLQDCDNRADPAVAMRWRGAHADDFMQIETITWETKDTSIKAWDNWAAALAKANRGYPRARNFTCPSFSDVREGIEAFSDIKPVEIIVGYYDPTDEMFAEVCDKSQSTKQRRH